MQNSAELQLPKRLSRGLGKHHRLVREQSTQWLGHQRLSRYRFARVLFQSYLYRELSEGERALLHGDMARALEELYVDHPDELENLAEQMARHCAMAGDEERGLTYARLAGERAKTRLAFAEAVAYLSRALELAPEDDPAGRYQLLLARQDAYRELGDTQREEQDLVALEALALRLGEEQQAEVSLRRARWAQRVGDAAGSLAAAQSALEWARAAGNAAYKVDALRCLAFRNLHRADYAAAQEEAEEALALFRALGNRSGELTALAHLSESPTEQGQLARARDLAQEGLCQARQTGRRESECWALSVLSCVHKYVGDYAGYREYSERALPAAREVGWQWMGTYWAILGRPITYWKNMMRHCHTWSNRSP